MINAKNTAKQGGMTKGLRMSAGLLRRRRPEEGLQGSFLSSSLSLLSTHTTTIPRLSLHHHPRQWRVDAGMYEPLYLTFDAYPSVVPRVRVRGVMALFLAVTILWALIW